MSCAEYLRLPVLFMTAALHTCAMAKESVRLTFFVGTPQSPPIIFQHQQQGPFVGIIPEIFATMPNSGVAVSYISHNRSRGEMALYNGQVDGTMLVKDWALQPDKLIFSEPLFTHREFLFGVEDYGNEPLSSLVNGRRICVRRGYVYPALEPYFKENAAKRLDSTSEQHQLQMLLKGRCDLMAMNELIAAWLIDSSDLSAKVYRSAEPTQAIDFTLAFNPDWGAFVIELNQHIKALKQSQQMEQIILRYAMGLDVASFQ